MQNKASRRERILNYYLFFSPIQATEYIKQVCLYETWREPSQEKVSDAKFLFNLLGMCIVLAIEC